ncbi:relaxase/mobilization nuclease domain-containing protein [Viscerimonas tarda]
MIAKAKAIAHGSRAIEYAMRESKKGDLIASNLIQDETPDKIYQEFVEAQKYNSRCKNKFIRIEIGIAPQDEAKLTDKELSKICWEFSRKFGFGNHQWIACTHRDTDNLHLHMIVNRMSIDNKVYQTDFISKRAGKIAEEISRQMGLTIANEVQRKEKYRPDVMFFERMMARTRMEQAAIAVLKTRPKSLKDFTNGMQKRGVTVTEAKNKKGNTYGLRFSGDDQTFKASQIGKEFGYRTLLNTFSENRQEEYQAMHQENNQSVDLGAAIAGGVLAGIGSIGSMLPLDCANPDDYNPSLSEEEKRKRKLKKKRRYGRQF